MSYARHLDEIESALRALKPAGDSGKHAEYIGGRGSKLEFLGLRVPQIDSVLKPGFAFYASKDAEILKVWHYVWSESGCYEAMSLPLAYYGHKKRAPLLPGAWPKLKSWVKRIDNWAHSDSLSSIYARTLEMQRDLVLPTLEDWSESKNPWKRRQSIVSLLYYSSARTTVLPFPKLAELILKQIDDPEYYVQKGVGWTLREMGNVYPEKTLKLLTQNIGRLSPYAFSASTEKLDPPAKAKLKVARKAARG